MPEPTGKYKIDTNGQDVKSGIVVFTDGIAYTDNESIADLCRRQRWTVTVVETGEPFVPEKPQA